MESAETRGRCRVPTTARRQGDRPLPTVQRFNVTPQDRVLNHAGSREPGRTTTQLVIVVSSLYSVSLRVEQLDSSFLNDYWLITSTSSEAFGPPMRSADAPHATELALISLTVFLIASIYTYCIILRRQGFRPYGQERVYRVTTRMLGGGTNVGLRSV